jgi:threonylcarbamoyladenosine tRNA methylthiotransferase MtaB
MTLSHPYEFQRAAITTLGCKVNTYESALIAQKLQQDRWTMVTPKDKADLYIINSCTVTAEAGRQTRQEIRRAISRNPAALVVVTGCYAEMERSACANIPGVDLVVGNSEKLSIVEHVRTFRGKVRQPQVRTRLDGQTGLSQDLLSGFTDRTRAFIQIQQGCDQSCNYCIIHRARGPSRSFLPDQVERQVQQLLTRGYREIVICGVDLGSWGRDLEDRSPVETAEFVDLLCRISNLPGDYRIRLSSIDPFHLEDKLLDLISSSDRFCPHLHISMQSANTVILKRMKRRYDAVFLYERLRAAHEKIPDLVLSADILVGFPTESHAQFEDTLRAIDDLSISYPHVFAYSARPGTPAARIPLQVPKAIRKQRSAWVRTAGGRVRQRVLSQQIGRCGRVLVERASLKSHGQSHGRLANYFPVRFSQGDIVPGEFLQGRVIGSSGDMLIARATSQE